jgi:hypothetical protein
VTSYQAAICILSRAYRGGAKIPGKVHDRGAYSVVFLGEVATHEDAATLEPGVLTRMVVAAHDEVVKLTICASGPGRIRVEFRPLKRWPSPERHPTMNEAVTAARKGHTT